MQEFEMPDVSLTRMPLISLGAKEENQNRGHSEVERPMQCCEQESPPGKKIQATETAKGGIGVVVGE